MWIRTNDTCKTIPSLSYHRKRQYTVFSKSTDIGVEMYMYNQEITYNFLLTIIRKKKLNIRVILISESHVRLNSKFWPFSNHVLWLLLPTYVLWLLLPVCKYKKYEAKLQRKRIYFLFVIMGLKVYWWMVLSFVVMADSL